MLIVLEARDPDAEIQASFARKLLAAVGEQGIIRGQTEPLTRKLEGWIGSLSLENRSLTLALVTLLFVSSLAFGLGSALQIDQVERPGISLSERIGSLLGARGPSVPESEQDIDPAPPNMLATYGAGFSWPDRFSSIEVRREIASSRVLWPLSTIISMLVLAVWLIPRSKREIRKTSSD